MERGGTAGKAGGGGEIVFSISILSLFPLFAPRTHLKLSIKSPRVLQLKVVQLMIIIHGASSLRLLLPQGQEKKIVKEVRRQ